MSDLPASAEKWRPIATAPRIVLRKTGIVPSFLLADARLSWRAIGYWGTGISAVEPTWCAIHNHLPVIFVPAYWAPMPEEIEGETP